MIPKGLANAIVVLVSVVWASNFVASLFVVGYQPDSAINFVFMTIVGGALALRGGPPGDSPNIAQRMSEAMRQPTPPSPPNRPGEPK